MCSNMCCIVHTNAYPLTRDYRRMWRYVINGVDLACKDGLGNPYHWGTCGMCYHQQSDGDSELSVCINIPNANPSISIEIDVNSSDGVARFIVFCQQHSIEFIDPAMFDHNNQKENKMSLEETDVERLNEDHEIYTDTMHKLHGIKPGSVHDYDIAVSGPYTYIGPIPIPTVSVDSFGPRESIDDEHESRINAIVMKGYDIKWKTENCQKMLKAIDAVAGCGLETFMRDMPEANDTYSAERLTLIHMWNVNMQHAWEAFIRDVRDMFTQQLLSLKAHGVNLDMHRQNN